MKKSNAFLSVLMAGLLAASGAYAQSTPAAGSSDGAPKAGEASNQTAGVPNAKTTNSPVSDTPIMSRGEVRATGVGQSTAAATSSIAPRAGEATTMVSGAPNIDPASVNRPLTRAEVRDELMSRSARLAAQRDAQRMGYNGYVVTPQ